MSRASNALAVALEDLRISQTAFARTCNLQLSQINRFTRGAVEMGASSLSIIARGLPERQRAEVIVAWLRDQVPEVASGLVSILSNATPRTADLGLEGGLTDDLSPALHQAVVYLIEQARRHQPISDLLIDLARALRGSN